MKNKRLLQNDITIENSENRIVISAHRGWSAQYPENTMIAYMAALEEDIDEIEIDVHLTKDEVPVLIHDSTVDRTTDAAGLVNEFTFKDLKKLDAGSWKGERFAGEQVPAVEELFSYLRVFPGILLNVEIKQRTFETVDKTMWLIEQYGLWERFVLTCFDANIIQYAKETYGAKCQGFPSSKMANFKFGPDGTYSHMYSVGVHDSLITRELREYFESCGIRFWTYCPDTDDMVKRHLAADSQLLTCNEIMPAIRILNEMGKR